MCDIDAWKHNTSHRWIYIKSNLCDIQSVKWYPCPVEPQDNDFPVIIRPLINLTGMGSEVVIANDIDEYRDMCCYGYFATSFLQGTHTSHDFDVINGEIETETIFQGHKNEETSEYPGTFSYWELISVNSEPNITSNIKALLDRLKTYTGPLNIECIGNVIIEAHLRRGDNDIIESIEKPLYLVPIWGTIYDDHDDNNKIDFDSLLKQPGVIDVIEDTEKISKTGNFLQRKALVITKELPSSMKK